LDSILSGVTLRLLGSSHLTFTLVLPMPPSDSNVPTPFIGDQELHLLHCPRGEDPFAYFKRDKFHSKAWRPVEPGRTSFLADTSIARLCVTIGGGIGKTTALEQAEIVRQAINPNHLAVFLESSELPSQMKDYLDTDHPADAEIVKRILAAARGVDPVGLRGLIQHRIRSGNFSLIVDALDQMPQGRKLGGQTPEDILRELKLLLQSYPSVRLIVSGRPWAVQHYREFFSGSGDWQFVKVAEFDGRQIQTYLTTNNSSEDRLSEVKRLEADLLRVPRFLKRLRTMEFQSLTRMRTAADLYWESVKEVLELGVKNQPSELKVERATLLLALLAWTMTDEGLSVNVPPDRFESYLSKAWENGGATLRRLRIIDPKGTEDVAFAQFVGWLERLMQLNTCTEQVLIDNHELTELHWQDKTLQDFFAAVWITRYGDQPAWDWLKQRPCLTGDEAQRDHYDVWRFAVGMPPDPTVRNDVRYVQAMSELYAVPDRLGDLARSSEMIYRSLPAMLQLSGFLSKRDWTEQDFHAAAFAAQEQACRMVFVNAPPPLYRSDVARQAGDLLLAYLSEFPRIVRSEHGTASQQRLAQDFQGWFVPIPPGESDSLTFWMGDKIYRQNREQQHASSIPGRIQMAKYPVTNALLSLFDNRHAQRFVNYKKYSPDPQCPAVYADWYTAWCVALWLGCRLPTEQEWEYACRAQPGLTQVPTKWHCGNTEAKLIDFAWYGERSGNKTHVVDREGIEGKRPNGWGLYHMHGNVWEWTSSWYHAVAEADQNPELGKFRVLRGGSFGDFAFNCRSANRLLRDPSDSYGYVGFRVILTAILCLHP
jgi:formylglycine-generating enzyme required for sulfatase activity